MESVCQWGNMRVKAGWSALAPRAVDGSKNCVRRLKLAIAVKGDKVEIRAFHQFNVKSA
jgi:hypothetical protein